MPEKHLQLFSTFRKYYINAHGTLELEPGYRSRFHSFQVPLGLTSHVRANGKVTPISVVKQLYSHLGSLRLSVKFHTSYWTRSFAGSKTASPSEAYHSHSTVGISSNAFVADHTDAQPVEPECKLL